MAANACSSMSGVRTPYADRFVFTATRRDEVHKDGIGAAHARLGRRADVAFEGVRRRLSHAATCLCVEHRGGQPRRANRVAFTEVAHTRSFCGGHCCEWRPLNNSAERPASAGFSGICSPEAHHSDIFGRMVHRIRGRSRCSSTNALRHGSRPRQDDSDDRQEEHSRRINDDPPLASISWREWRRVQSSAPRPEV
jgi:hypothetical protein